MNAAATLNECEGAARDLGRAATNLRGPESWGAKTFVGINMFYWHLSAFAKSEDPLPEFIRLCRNAQALLDGAQGQSAPLQLQLSHEKRTATDLSNLGDLYSAVYTEMSDKEYFDDSREVVRGRLEANGIRPNELFGGKTVLDAGCGGGKFTQAIASFGATKVIGIDIGADNVRFARKQAGKVPHGSVIDYREGSVLDIPLEDSSVDFVWCNSVAHLTGDQNCTMRELARVLRPGGQLFYYVNGRFGLFEVLLKMLVQIMDGIPSTFVQHFLQCLGVGPGRISWVIACIFAPYEFRPRTDVEALLRQNGFSDIRLLERGIDIDYSEKIARGEPFADVKYGEGQLRYLARKT